MQHCSIAGYQEHQITSGPSIRGSNCFSNLSGCLIPLHLTLSRLALNRPSSNACEAHPSHIIVPDSSCISMWYRQVVASLAHLLMPLCTGHSGLEHWH